MIGCPKRTVVPIGILQRFHFRWIRLICLASIVSLVVDIAAAARAGDSKAQKRPNFVVFFVDDLGYGDLGFTGHPTTKTPNLDRLAWNGKILTTWYSGCNVCTGSRASLMTGRQFPRTGLPGVIGPDCSYGLNLDEITIAQQLKKGGYATGIVGKWHLGQRKVYLPGNRGFDSYLGIPFSDDMGVAWESSCPATDYSQDKRASSDYAETVFRRDKKEQQQQQQQPFSEAFHNEFDNDNEHDEWSTRELYEKFGFLNAKGVDNNTKEPDKAATKTTTSAAVNDKDKPPNDKGTKWLPLIHQKFNETRILEQPVDLTTLAQKYSDFATNFIKEHHTNSSKPFFLYVPFSHVHCTSYKGHSFEKQYAGCDFRNSTERGIYGDALAETDWIVGNIVQTIRDLDIEEDTLILFTSDNGPWMTMGLSGGSAGVFTGRFAEGYTNTAKGTTWEGGIREPAFAYWKGKISPFSRSSEIISSLDVFSTLSTLAGIPLPEDRPLDGKDMSQILLRKDGRSKHDFLFFYGTCSGEKYWSIAGVRHGKYKAHWCTSPGLGPYNRTELTKRYDPPLLFDVEKDPSESEPISYNKMPKKTEDLAAMKRILAAYAMEKSTFRFGNITQEPDGPGEGPGHYALCCDESKECYCKDDHQSGVGILNLGTKKHHDEYHKALGEDEPLPARTNYQAMLRNEQ